MWRSRSVCRLTGVLLFPFAACSKSSTAPSPIPAPGSHPTIAIAAIAAAAEAVPTGYRYRTTLTLRESIGVPATIVSVDLMFAAGTAHILTSHYEKPISDAVNVCPASGAIDTRELEANGDASHPVATAVTATVTYTDGTFSGTVSSTAEISRPPVSQAFSISGIVTDVSTRSVIVGAQIQALNGVNAGRAGTTDANGAYTITDLAPDTFRLRASAAGYDAGEQNVTVPTTARADFELARVSDIACGYVAISNSPAVLPWDGGEYTVTVTRTSGACAWQASTDVGWLTFPHGASANGSATLSYAVAPNGLNSRSGTITIAWTGGSARISVQQAPHPDWECFVGLTRGPEDFDNVPSAGGTVTVFASVWAVPSGWSCTATVSGTVSWIVGGGTINGPTTMTFRIGPNPSPGTSRAGSIVAQTGQKTATQGLTQR
jgi:hypothetical protein